MVAIPNIEEFKSKLINGGARPTMFSVSCSFPNLSGNLSGKTELTYLSYMAKAASIPESTINPISVGYYGRTVKLAGDRTYPNWGITIINSEDFVIRRTFEDWHYQLNAPVENVRATGMVPIRNYKTDVTVTQLSQDGNELRSYRMIGAWPVQLGDIQLNWDVQNTIEEFGVTFAFDYWVPLDSSGATYVPANLADVFGTARGIPTGTPNLLTSSFAVPTEF